MLCRGTNRYMDEAFCSKVGIQQRELITEKEVEAMEPCSTDWRQSRTEETRAEGSHCPEEPAGYTTSTIAVRGRNSEIVPEFEGPQPPLKTAISKFVMKLLATLRSGRARLWWCYALGLNAFKIIESIRYQNGTKLLTKRLASSSPRRKQQDEVRILQEFQRFCDVCASDSRTHWSKYKEFVFHRGCSYDTKSFLDEGLIAGEREKQGGRQSIFFTSFNLFGENLGEEAPSKSLREPRKVHYRSFWKLNQDAAFWVRLSSEHKIKVKSHAIVVNDHVPAACINRVISQNGEQILIERMLFPRLAPKIVLKSR